MNKTDLKAGDLLIDFQKGFAREFKVVQENNDLFLESGTIRQKVEDNLTGRFLLLTSNDINELT
jgi:hypothetical protein